MNEARALTPPRQFQLDAKYDITTLYPHMRTFAENTFRPNLLDNENKLIIKLMKIYFILFRYRYFTICAQKFNFWVVNTQVQCKKAANVASGLDFIAMPFCGEFHLTMVNFKELFILHSRSTRWRWCSAWAMSGRRPLDNFIKTERKWSKNLFRFWPEIVWRTAEMSEQLETDDILCLTVTVRVYCQNSEQ